MTGMLTNLDSPGLSGFGMAINWEQASKLREDLTLSAAILDLGFISWSNTIKAERQVTLHGNSTDCQNIAMESDDADGDKPLEDQLEDLGNDIENYASFHRTETGSSSTEP